MKNATQSQIDQLEILKNKIQLSNDLDANTEMFSQVKDLLKEIDFMSSFYNNFVRDMKIGSSKNTLSLESSLMKILEDAIEQYKQK